MRKYTYESLVPQEQVERALNLVLSALTKTRFRWPNQTDKERQEILAATKALRNVIDGIVDPEPAELRDLFRQLPFATSIQYGNTYRHIVNESFFTVRTADHSINCDEPLCGRSRYGLKDEDALAFDENKYHDCPGCLAKGRALAARAL